jgi:hypothetical protein
MARFRADLRNGHRSLVRCVTFNTAKIDAFHGVAVGGTANYGAIDIRDRRVWRRVYQHK